MSPEVIVAGCGPAGMMAAIAAAERGARVTVLEGMERPGKKLLLTGNGKCNLTNLNPALPESYRSVEEGGTDTARRILDQFSVKDTMDFFHKLGLLTTDRNGYVYPRTGQSASVLELLLARMRQLRIKLKYSEKIRAIRREDDGLWQVTTGSWTYRCHRLILCCGSKAAAATGSDGSGYELARQAGHRITSILPALTALKGKKQPFLPAAAGVRCPAKVSLYGIPLGDAKEQFLSEDTGELQLNEEGISGIVVFQGSRYAALALSEGKRVSARLDFLPEKREMELSSWIKGRQSLWAGADVPVQSALSGLLPGKLLTAVLRETGIKPAARMDSLGERQITELVRQMKGFILPVTGTRGFAQCQVCAGGIALEEVNGATLESKKCPGLFFAGEILDVDGPCGGYNLQWAWSSGYVAGSRAAGADKVKR